MKTARLVVLGVALAAGVGAAFLVSQSKSPEPTAAVAPPAAIATDDVMVAAHDLLLGSLVDTPDIRWQSWPKSNVPPGLILKSEAPNAMDDIKGSIVRSGFSAGEPMRRERLVKGANAGFLSAVLPSGSRAVAINIDAQGSTSAGGFILPNDHVDVIRTYHDEAAAKGGGDGFTTETILSNIRVLAIGQNIQEKNAQPVVVGSNATLELTPRQAEVIILAQRVGQLSLVLRSMADSQATTTAEVAPPPPQQGMTVVRYGIKTQSESH